MEKRKLAIIAAGGVSGFLFILFSMGAVIAAITGMFAEAPKDKEINFDSYSRTFEILGRELSDDLGFDKDLIYSFYIYQNSGEPDTATAKQYANIFKKPITEEEGATTESLLNTYFARYQELIPVPLTDEMKQEILDLHTLIRYQVSGFPLSPCDINMHDYLTDITGVNEVSIPFEGYDRQYAYAAYDGVVLSKTFDKVYGNMVTIQHPDGNISKYGHLNIINVSIGDEVKGGNKIGIIGNTGKTENNKNTLYFYFEKGDLDLHECYRYYNFER